MMHHEIKIVKKTTFQFTRSMLIALSDLTVDAAVVQVFKPFKQKCTKCKIIGVRKLAALKQLT